MEHPCRHSATKYGKKEEIHCFARAESTTGGIIATSSPPARRGTAPPSVTMPARFRTPVGRIQRTQWEAWKAFGTIRACRTDIEHRQLPADRPGAWRQKRPGAHHRTHPAEGSATHSQVPTPPQDAD